MLSYVDTPGYGDGWRLFPRRGLVELGVSIWRVMAYSGLGIILVLDFGFANLRRGSPVIILVLGHHQGNASSAKHRVMEGKGKWMI